MPKTKIKTTRKIKPYVIEMIFNGSSFRKRTDNVNQAITDLKPDVLFTELYATFKSGKYVIERNLNLIQGKRLFNNDDFREAFISNLMLP